MKTIGWLASPPWPRRKWRDRASRPISLPMRGMVGSLKPEQRAEPHGSCPWIFILTILGFSLLAGCDRAPQRYLKMAEERWNQGDYLGAAREYERIIHEYPKSGPAAEAYFWTGIIAYLYLHDPQRGLEAFSKLAADFPKSSQAPAAFGYMAEIYDRRLGQPQRAIVAYQRLIGSSRDPQEIAESQYRIG